MTTTKRKRRGPEEMIRDLQAEIERIHVAQKSKASPAHKQAKVALRALTKASDLAAKEGDADLERDIMQAIKALESSAGSAAGATGRVRRSQEDIEAFSAAIWDALSEQPDVSISELAGALKATPKDVRGPLKALLEAGHLRKKGERRGTRYFTKGRRPV